MLLRISQAIKTEWWARCIGDVVPALAELPWDSQSVINVTTETALAIRADCEFYADPNAVDATASERAAYRALLKQINAAL